jgi:hypothetical protein
MIEPLMGVMKTGDAGGAISTRETSAAQRSRGRGFWPTVTLVGLVLATWGGSILLDKVTVGRPSAHWAIVDSRPTGWLELQKGNEMVRIGGVFAQQIDPSAYFERTVRLLSTDDIKVVRTSEGESVADGFVIRGTAAAQGRTGWLTVRVTATGASTMLYLGDEAAVRKTEAEIGEELESSDLGI